MNMLASEHHLHAKCLVQVAHPWHLWKHCGHCFICWRDLSVRMEQATASSNAVEIRLQELRSNAVTRGREWLQGALEEISAMELRKMASARNVGRGPDKKWLAVGELRALLLEVLAPPMQVGCGKKRLWRKLNVCYMVQCCGMSAVLWLRCVACCWPVGSWIGCQIGRTSRRSCFTRCWVAP